MKMFTIYKNRNLFFYILLLIWAGGQMGCAMKKADQNLFPYWKGKSPVLVIAHRGFSGAAPENTLAAFRKAIEIGCDMIELDVHLTRDGQVVVIHDESLERTTNGRGKVKDYTLAQLKKLDAGSWFSSQFSGEQIPTLKEVLQLAKGKVPVCLEIKTKNLDLLSIRDLADKAWAEVRNAGMENQVIFFSFHPYALERIQEKDARVWVLFLYQKPWNYVHEITGGRSFPALGLNHSHLTKDKIVALRQKGMKIKVWTVNEEADMEKFIPWQVDGIITNHPEKLIRILRN
jgi:glycerophosphoryl diester phosphodiesterase